MSATALRPTLTTDQLAAELHRSVETVIRWRRTRRGPPYLRVCGRVVYDVGEVQAWLQRQRDPHAKPEAA